MSYTPEGFFDNVGGSGAPSVALRKIDDYVSGEIVDQYVTEATEFATGEVKKDKKTGKVIEQLVVILQTDLRGWAQVSRVPYKERGNANSGTKDPSEDDGKRALYIEPWTNIHAAVAAAIVAATGQRGPLLNGGRLDVKVTDLRDTGKGNPLKIHAARYTPPAAGGDFFGAQNTDAPQQAAPAAAPPAQAAPPPQSDPWGSPASSRPPF